MFRIAMGIVMSGSLLIATPDARGQSDTPGSADHPLFGRYDGSWIAAHRDIEFDEFSVATGKVDRAGENTLRLEGHVTKIVYHIADTTSVLQIFRNYELRMQDAGFDVLFQCAGRSECGNEFKSAFARLPMPLMWGGEDYRYVVGRKSDEASDLYAAVLCETLGGSGKRACQLTTIERETMAYRMVDADAMAEAIAESGSIALYGIYFDTASADLKAESESTLTEIAALLGNQPALKLVVVGHTDNQGAFDYNMDLSQRRAAAVRDALVQRYGIEASRLRSWGVGFLAPVATNRTEEGRALNRRVQLVEQ